MARAIWPRLMWPWRRSCWAHRSPLLTSMSVRSRSKNATVMRLAGAVHFQLAAARFRDEDPLGPVRAGEAGRVVGVGSGLGDEELEVVAVVLRQLLQRRDPGSVSDQLHGSILRWACYAAMR